MTPMEWAGLETGRASRQWMHVQNVYPYTDFVSSLDRHGDDPSKADLDRVMKSLRSALRGEISRRGLWDCSPEILGVVGCRSWDERTALDELTVDCYVHVFIKRRRSLVAQLRTKANIDGLVYLNVRNFVHDSQKRNDPMGFRVFDVFRSAVEACLVARHLFALKNAARLANDTLLSFSPNAWDIESRLDHGEVDLETIVAHWNDELLPDLMVARGRKLAAVIAAYSSKVQDLERYGIEAFYYRDLMQPLKKDARRRWATIWQHGEGSMLVNDALRSEGQGPTSATFEEFEDLNVLSSCIEDKLKAYPGQQRSRRHLLKLWEYLKCFAISDVDTGSGRGLWETMEEQVPSDRELSKKLGIPRERFKELFGTIKQAATECKGWSKSGSGQTGASEPLPGRVRRRAMQDRQDKLLQQTKEAYRSLAEDRQDDAGKRPLRLGGLYVLAASSELGVEWLAYEERQDGCWRMIPGDTHSWVGSADWGVANDALGPLTFRCKDEHLLDEKIFESAVISARLTPQQLESLSQHLGQQPIEDDDRLEVDQDSEYREWCGQLREVSEALACSARDGGTDETQHKNPGDERGASPRGVRSRGLSDGFLARAALILLAVGMAHWSGRWATHSSSLTESGEMQAQLQRQLEVLSTSQQALQTTVQDLIADKLGGSHPWTLVTTGRVRGEVQSLEVRADTALQFLLLELPTLQPEDRLQVIGPKGDVLWTDQQIGNFDNVDQNLITIPTAVLPEGDVTLTVSGQRDGQTQELFVKRLAIHHLDAE